MIPDKYIFDKADSLSNFLDRSRFNGLLLDGLLAYMNNNPNRTLTLDPLGFFNTAYYFANRVMFELFPEIDIRNHYIGECMDRTHDVVTRDIVITMLYVILDRIANPPGKVIRFCNQLEVIYNYREGYLGDLTQISEDCDNAGVSSDWYWTPPAVAGYSLIGIEVDWREATENFKYDDIKAYCDSCYDGEDRYFVMKDVVDAFKKYYDSHPNEFTDDQIRKIEFLFSHADFEYKKIVKAAEEKKKQEEEASKQAEKPLPPAPTPKELELQAELDSKIETIAQMEKDMEHKNAYIREHNDKESELNRKLHESEELVCQLQEQLKSYSGEDDNDEPDERTQKVVTNYLFSILKKAGMGNETTDYNKTDVSELIHYFTGFSSNTIRQTLTYPRLTSAAKKEVMKAAALLKKVNLDISIK